MVKKRSSDPTPVEKVFFESSEEFLPTSYRFFWDSLLDEDKVPKKD